MWKRELVALLGLSSWRLVMVERLSLTVPRGNLRFVIVVFPDHTHLLFLPIAYFNLVDLCIICQYKKYGGIKHFDQLWCYFFASALWYRMIQPCSVFIFIVFKNLYLRYCIIIIPL